MQGPWTQTGTRARQCFRALAFLPALAWRMVRWHLYRGNWLPGHLRRHRPFRLNRLPQGTPIDVMVALVDHYEPTSDYGDLAAVESVKSWCEGYKAIASRYLDHDGCHPQHTWFYRAEYPNFGCIQALGRYAFKGLGETEFHLHHGFDTHETFSAKLRAGLDWFNQAGAMITTEPEPKQRFAYIAGNWGLDNGTGDPSHSGCNTELLALRDAGCYADFTFPAGGVRAQPRKTNSIYYATDTPLPKSYDTGIDVAVGRPPSGDLLIFQGPSVIDWSRGRVEMAAVESFAPPSPDRLGAWLKANVHVQGRPEWIFVKLHTHGMQSQDTMLGRALDDTFRAMVATWNRPPFRLHFVTAREAYNIVKAAEAGRVGDPGQYRDFLIPPPANRRLLCSGPYRLLHYGPDRIKLEVLSLDPVRLDFLDGPLRSLTGRVRHLELVFQSGMVDIQAINGDPPFEAELRPSNSGPGVSRPVFGPCVLRPDEGSVPLEGTRTCSADFAQLGV